MTYFKNFHDCHYIDGTRASDFGYTVAAKIDVYPNQFCAMLPWVKPEEKEIIRETGGFWKFKETGKRVEPIAKILSMELNFLEKSL